jgi:hypothetical protein
MEHQTDATGDAEVAQVPEPQIPVIEIAGSHSEEESDGGGVRKEEEGRRDIGNSEGEERGERKYKDEEKGKVKEDERVERRKYKEEGCFESVDLRMARRGERSESRANSEEESKPERKPERVHHGTLHRGKRPVAFQETSFSAREELKRQGKFKFKLIFFAIRSLNSASIFLALFLDSALAYQIRVSRKFPGLESRIFFASV